MDRFKAERESCGDDGKALERCGVPEQNPSVDRRDGEGEWEDGDYYPDIESWAYETALEASTPDDVKLVAKCLLNHRKRGAY